MEHLDKLENKIKNLIEAVKALKTENISLKTELNRFKETTVKNDKDKDEIQNKVLKLIEMIDDIKEKE